MSGREPPDATRLATRVAAGDSGAVNELFPLIYEELKALARAYFSRERPGHTLQPTAIANEVYVRLVDQRKMDWRSRSHFFAVAAQQLRRVLKDHGRGQKAAKRGAGWRRVTLGALVSPTRDVEVDALDLEEALRELSVLNERHGRIVELRFFSELTVDEVAEVLGVSPSVVEKDWRLARAWLSQRLEEGYSP